MTLILGDVRLDLRQFPDLMPQRLGVAARQFLAAAAALSRLERPTSLQSLGGHQGPLVLGMTGLAAPFLLGLGCRGGAGLACGCCAAGRQRGVLRRLVQAGFQFRPSAPRSAVHNDP